MPAIEGCITRGALFRHCVFQARRQIPADDDNGKWKNLERFAQSLADFGWRGILGCIFEILRGDRLHLGGKMSITVKSTQNKPFVFGTLSRRACPISWGGS